MVSYNISIDISRTISNSRVVIMIDITVSIYDIAVDVDFCRVGPWQ
jgi:hypothetical protein